MHSSEILSPSLRDLDETLDEFEAASFQAAERLLGRLVYQLNEEPIAGFLRSVLPKVDFQSWYSASQASIGSMAGSGVFDFPHDRPTRVALQIELCRAIAEGTVRFLDFAINYFYSGNALSGHSVAVARGLLRPLVRDIERLAESRPIPPILFEAMGHLPTSGDAKLDELVREACSRFADPAPKARYEAVERLWDAWERLKTVEIPEDKPASASQLLAKAAKEPTFRERLAQEAKALTEIGNTFHIRHFETNRVELTSSAHAEYLFHRLYALIHLLIFSRSSSGDALYLPEDRKRE